jgi:cell wall assembly regulator SMI1
MSGRMGEHMAKPEIVGSKPPATEAAIARLEKQLEGKFPASYRQFLERHNGGQPQPATFVPVDRTEPTEVINSFLAVDGDPKIDDMATFLKRYEKRLPKGCFPVAYDAFGNLICMALEEPDRGHIYFLNHEGGAKRLIAQDWDKFLNSFQPPLQETKQS